MSDIAENMSNLSVQDDNARSGSNTGGRRSYVPPHVRGQQRSGSGNYRGSERGSYFGGDDRRGGGYGRGGGRGSFNWGGSNWGGRGDSRNGGGYGRNNSSGRWIDGKHVPAQRNANLELELFGAAEDKSFQSSGINFDNYDDIPVEASGTDVPEPITEFTSPPLDPVLLENINLARFTKPTPVQKYSVPIVANGRDLMACAQTGSGKTGGFLFPVLSSSFSSGPAPTPESAGNSYIKKVYPTAVILAPTRELATQIYDEAKKFTYRSWVKPMVVYGGASIDQQIKQMRYGCNLLVATPGRLTDLLERRYISLANVKYLVLDEADRMLDMGFEPQIRRIVEGSDMPSVENRQTLMFSATFPSEIQHLASDFLKDYIFLSVGRVGSTSENITQKILYVEDFDKNDTLLDLLSADADGLTLIFVETKRAADSLTDFLIMEGFKATAIHGDRTQGERERALSAFKTGRATILVATAVAARGLDIPNVTHVINFDLPNDIDDYVHRIGRTGRAGNTGVATAFFNRGNKNVAKDLVNLLSEANQEVPSFLTTIMREASSGRGGGRGGSRGGYSRGSGTRDFRRGGASNG
ncbi:DEAD-box ATP-dependent RNA helicase, partial [Kluyveromyces marxianus]